MASIRFEEAVVIKDTLAVADVDNWSTSDNRLCPAVASFLSRISPQVAGELFANPSIGELADDDPFVLLTRMA